MAPTTPTIKTRNWPPRNHVEWRTWVETPDVKPIDPLPASKSAKMSAKDKHAHTEARKAYHRRMGIILTPALEGIIADGKELIDETLDTDGSPCGLAITGPARVGKTTALTQLGRAADLTYRHREPDRTVPVIFVQLKARTTPRQLVIKLSRFLGLDHTARVNYDDALHAVVTTMRTCGTVAILVDEAHHLSWGRQTAEDSSDFVKHLADETGVPVILAGINLHNERLFTGQRSNQIGGRYVLHPLDRYGYRTKPEIKQWKSLIATFDQRLSLANHPTGAMVELAQYLHERTDGFFGGLDMLIRRAAIRAIDTGHERLDRGLLDNIRLDSNSEKHRRSSRAKKAA